VRYEIYLRMPEGSQPLVKEKAVEVLSKQGLETGGDALGKLDLGQGDLRAEAHTKSDWDAAESSQETTDRLLGINFSFPLGLPDAEGDRAVQIILNAKEQLAASLFDPQLGTLVARADTERIIQSWRQSHEFHFSIAGTPGLGSSAPTTSHPSSGIPTRIKIVLLLGICIVAAVFLLRNCLGRWMEKEMNPPAPIETNPGR
jgi:hypothetical protein